MNLTSLFASSALVLSLNVANAQEIQAEPIPATPASAPAAAASAPLKILEARQPQQAIKFDCKLSEQNVAGAFVGSALQRLVQKNSGNSISGLDAVVGRSAEAAIKQDPECARLAGRELGLK